MSESQQQRSEEEVALMYCTRIGYSINDFINLQTTGKRRCTMDRLTPQRQENTPLSRSLYYLGFQSAADKERKDYNGRWALMKDHGLLNDRLLCVYVCV